MANQVAGPQRHSEATIDRRERASCARGRGGGSKEAAGGWQRFRAESLLGASIAGEKKYAAAEPLLFEGYQGMVARKDRIAVPDRYHLDRAREWIVQLYQAWGKPAKAAEWAKK
jgi:hypothetical protein